MALAMAAVLAASAALAESFNAKGMISLREGNRITLTYADGTSTDMMLTPDTKVVSISGKLGLQKNDLTLDDVITGLPVSIDATRNGDEIDVDKLSFKSGDLKTARQIEAGTAQAKAKARAKAEELQAQNDELKRRMSEANQYVEKASTTVLFATGSAVISAQGKADLHQLAAQAKAIKGYWISVIGYADTTGNPEANQMLSERRAAAVTNFLQKFCGVAAQRVLAADAMGEDQQVGDTASVEGKAQNRRVVVKVLTNKGLEGL
jgi:outer membrane protein OmpA-like peptidoglycan-associated protein